MLRQKVAEVIASVRGLPLPALPALLTANRRATEQFAFGFRGPPTPHAVIRYDTTRLQSIGISIVNANPAPRANVKRTALRPSLRILKRSQPAPSCGCVLDFPQLCNPLL